jgi:aminoglycoside/choline kinase family phosphotransferase
VGAVMAEWGLPVPKVQAVDAALGMILLEDLGNCSLQERLRSCAASEREALYREAAADLGVLQRASVATPRAEECFQLAFDVEKLIWELDFFRQHFLCGLRARRLSPEDGAELATGFERLCGEIASWPRVLCHRDFHSRNLMWHEGRLRWIDFQDARMGPDTYDLASLLRDSYVELDEGFVSERLEAFRASVAPHESRPSFLRRFELTAIQRNLKALGTFGYQATQRGNSAYLEYVPRTLRHARRNLLRYPELNGIWAVLARHLEEYRS